MIVTRRGSTRLLVAVTVALAFTATAYGKRRAVSPPEFITILQTTDIHDHANGAAHVGLDVDPATGTGMLGAYSRIASYVGFVRATTGHPVILIDSGDWTMGTLYDLTLESKPLALFFLNAMHYDAITLGNHEFDYTPRGLAGMIVAAKTAFNFNIPIVASNMTLGGDTNLAPLFGTGKMIQPEYVETLSNGMKIGFIGLMGEDAAVDAPASAPVSFAPLSKNYATIQAMVDDLRKNQGANVVIALSHSGTSADGNSGEDVNLARSVRGIDVIASGHTHTPLAQLHSVTMCRITGECWTTQIIDAGAFGTNVARLDLAVNRRAGQDFGLPGTTAPTAPVAYKNVPMTNATLTAAHAGLAPDAATTALVSATDSQLNAGLGPVLGEFFPDYSAANLGKGIYHPVAAAAQDMLPNDRNPVLSPNGLGDLCADSVRNTANGIVAKTLAAVGGTPANLPGYDFNPYQAAVVGTGVIRATLPAGVPLTFADIYDVLPLGISPDTSQALPIGYPMMSTYIDPGDVPKICAFQLIGQSNLLGSSFYLNISGLHYTLKPNESYTYFKYATAATVLTITEEKAAEGSLEAIRALEALIALPSDNAASIFVENASNNPFAVAMVKLNDPVTNFNQVVANLTVVGEVATAALSGTRAVGSLVASKAVAAIDTVSGFAPTDGENTGATTPLGASRIRVAADLYSILLLNAVDAQYGIKITPFQAATGTTVLSGADFPTLLGNRIDLAPATPGIQELKEWMALLSNVGGGLKGKIGPEYASTPNFEDFPSSGAAVHTRNDTYPLGDIRQLALTSVTLENAP